MNPNLIYRESSSIAIEGVYLTFDSLDLLADQLVETYILVQTSHCNNLVRLSFDLPMLDTRGKHMLMRFTKAFDSANSKPNTGNIQIEWRYHYEDEDMEEFGEIIQEATSLDVHMIQVENYSVMRKV